MDLDTVLVEPLRIKNYQPDGWATWYHQFRLHTSLKPFEKLQEREKVAFLLLNLGNEVTPILETFGVDVYSLSYDELVRRLKIYFQPAKARNVLLNLKQKSGESFEHFESRLKLLSGPCGYGPFSDDFVRDIFLNNIDKMYSNVRDKILESYPDPKLPDVVGITDKLLMEECSARYPVVPTQSQSTSYCSEDLKKRQTNDASKAYNRSQNLVREARRSDELDNFSSMLSSTSIEIGHEVEVLITGMYQNCIHVSPTCPEEKSEQLQSLLNESLDKHSTSVSVEQYKICAVKLDNKWFRVIVLTVDLSRRTASVQSMDFNWKKTVDLSEFRLIPPDFVGRVLKVTPEPEITWTVGERVRLIFIDVKKFYVNKTISEIWTVKLADVQNFNNHLQGSRSTEDGSCYTDYETKGKGLGETGKKRNENRARNNYKRSGQQSRRSKDLDLETADEGNDGMRGMRGRQQQNKREQNEEFNNRQQGRGQNERGRDGFYNKRPGGGHNEGGKDISASVNRKGQVFDRNGDGNGFRNESETTGRVPNGRQRNYDGTRSMNEGNIGTKIGNERGNGNNRHSGGERGDSGHAQTSPMNDPMPEAKIGNERGTGNNRHSRGERGDSGHAQTSPMNDPMPETKIGNERGTGNNSLSRGERGDSGHAQTSPMNDPMPELNKLQLVDNPPIPYGQFTRVTVSHAVSDKVAYVYPESLGAEFSEASVKLQEMFEGKDLSGRRVLLNPKKGMYCAAPFDGYFFRAEVREVKQSEAKVFFLDYGNEEVVPCKHLFQLPRELSQAQFTFPIKVSDPFSLSSSHEMTVIEVRPKRMAADGLWIVDVGGCSRATSPVSCRTSKEHSGHRENVEAQGFTSKSAGQLPGVRNGSTGHRENSEAQGFTSKSAGQLPGVRNGSTGFKSISPGQLSGVQNGNAVVAPGSTRSTNASLEPPVDDAPVRSPKPPIPKNEFTEVRVVYTGTEGTFVVPHNKLESMQALLEAVVKATENESTCTTPVLKNVYAAPYEGDIYRAKVLSIDRVKSTCLVEFVDFGNQCQVSIIDLIELPLELTKIAFVFKIRVDPKCDVVLKEGLDVNISPITMESDGCWLVQLEGEPLTADYQLPEPSETGDGFIGFRKNSAGGTSSRGSRGPFQNN